MHPFLSQLDTSLSRTLASPAYQVELATLQTSVTGGPLSTADSWRQVREYIDSVRFKSIETDIVLRPLLLAAQHSGMTELWQNILLYLASPGLRMLLDTRRTLCADYQILWADITWAFLNAVRRINVDSRHELLGRKIINDTDHDLRAAYKSERGINALFVQQHNEADPDQADSHSKSGEEDHPSADKNPSHETWLHETTAHRHMVRCIPLEVEDDDEGYRPSPLDLIPSSRIEEAEPIVHIERQWAIRRLRQLHRNGTLSRSDFLILLGCCLYGRSLDEMAARLGVTYATAKKRRQRAIGRLEKSAPYLSPNLPDSPLYLIDRSCRLEECRE